jgi:hypothetical protein
MKIIGPTELLSLSGFSIIHQSFEHSTIRPLESILTGAQPAMADSLAAFAAMPKVKLERGAHFV